MKLMDAPEYEYLVKDFRELTRGARENGRCCLLTFGTARTPDCCEQIALGSPLSFTRHEVDVLSFLGPLPADAFYARLPSVWDVNRAKYSSAEIRELLHTGWLATALENASHPLRPVLNGNRVIGVVAPLCCNLTVSMDRYREHRVRLKQLWQRAVDGLGVKPYYITYDLRSDLVVL